jgi:uncharacterized protein YraI
MKREGIHKYITMMIGMTMLWMMQPQVARSGTLTAAIVEPFLEIHAGPGKSYPVFYISEKGESIEILKRRGDWYKVLLSNGKSGWVVQEEVEKTLLESGYSRTWIDRLYDRVVSDRLQMGWSAGTFGDDSAIYIRAQYKLTEQIALEGNTGFASGDLGSTQIYHGGILLTPWEKKWVSVRGTIGGGIVHVEPSRLLIKVEGGTYPEAHAGLGLSIPLFRNMAVRGDLRNFTLFMSPERTREFQEYSLGLQFQF